MGNEFTIDKFTTANVGKHLTILDFGSTVASSGAGGLYHSCNAYGSIPIISETKNRYSWVLTIGQKYGTMMIGISSQRDITDGSWINIDYGYSSEGEKWHLGKKEKYGNSFKRGDTVKMRVDFAQKAITFKLNDNKQCVAFKNIKKIKPIYYLVVSVDGGSKCKHDSISIKYFKCRDEEKEKEKLRQQPNAKLKNKNIKKKKKGENNKKKKKDENNKKMKKDETEIKIVDIESETETEWSIIKLENEFEKEQKINNQLQQIQKTEKETLKQEINKSSAENTVLEIRQKHKKRNKRKQKDKTIEDNKLKTKKIEAEQKDKIEDNKEKHKKDKKIEAEQKDKIEDNKQKTKKIEAEQKDKIEDNEEKDKKDKKEVEVETTKRENMVLKQENATLKQENMKLKQTLIKLTLQNNLLLDRQKQMEFELKISRSDSSELITCTENTDNKSKKITRMEMEKNAPNKTNSLTKKKKENEYLELNGERLDYTKWKHWDSTKVYDFIMSTVNDGSLDEYKHDIKKDLFELVYTGHDLTEMDKNELKAMGIKKSSPRTIILEAIQNLIQNYPVMNEGIDERIDENVTPILFDKIIGRL